MAVKFISIKCPECGAKLDLEENRNQCFCSYCGTKIIVNNDNEYIYRQFDEARIKESDNEKMIRLRELEMEERQIQNEENLFKTGLKIALIMFVLSLVVVMLDFEWSLGLFLWLLAGALFVMLISVVNHDEAMKNRKK